MIQAIQLILALSFLVLIHELGHFTFAKIFHVRVEKFYLFFNPWISLIRFKKFDGKRHVKFFAPNNDEEWAQHPENTEYPMLVTLSGIVIEVKPEQLAKALS